MLKKTNLLLPLIVMLCAMLLGVFNLTPLARLSTYILLLFSTIGHGVFVRFYKYYPQKIRFWYKIGLGLMLLSIVMQYIINGQSLLSGFVANFRFFNIGVIAFVYYLVIKYKISIKTLLNGLIKVGWVNLLIIGLFAFFGFSFVNTSELTGEVVIVHAGKLKKTFINFVAIIYLARYFYKSKYKYLLIAIVFFSANHFYELQRFSLLVQLAVVSFAFIKTKNIKIKIKFFIPSLIATIFFIVFLFNSQIGDNIVQRFSQALLIFYEDGERQITDSSTAARLWETDIAINHFYNSPILGNGLFRSSEKKQIFGDVHFFLSDIGVVGVLYAFGLVGMVVLFLQYKYAFDNRNIGKINPWLNISVLFLVFFQLDSVLTGKSILMYSSFLFCVFLVEFAKEQTKTVLK